MGDAQRDGYLVVVGESSEVSICPKIDAIVGFSYK